MKELTPFFPDERLTAKVQSFAGDTAERDLEEKLSLYVESALERLGRELPSAVVALQFASLLPEDAVPWLWLRELSETRNSQMDSPTASTFNWESVRAALEELALLSSSDYPELAFVHPAVASVVISTLSEKEVHDWRSLIRGLVERRRTEFQSIKDELLDGLLRGGVGQKGFYVAPAVEVRARAEASGKVDCRQLPDGSFILSLKDSAFWEQRCFRAFVAQELRRTLDAIEWALENGEPEDDFSETENRLKALVAENSQHLQAQKIHALILLARTSRDCRQGFDRAAWNAASEAVRLLETLKQKHPLDISLDKLLANAKDKQWLYDW